MKKNNTNKHDGLREFELNDKSITRRTFVGFGVLVGMYGLGFAGWKWLHKQPEDSGFTAITKGIECQ